MSLYRAYPTLYIVHMGLNASETRLPFSCKEEWSGMLSSLSLKFPMQYGTWSITGGHEGSNACKEGVRQRTWNTAMITIHTGSQSRTMSTNWHHCYTAVHWYEWTAASSQRVQQYCALPIVTTGEDRVQATVWIYYIPHESQTGHLLFWLAEYGRSIP